MNNGDFFEDKSIDEVLEFLLAETAKASSELRSSQGNLIVAQKDVNKAAGRLGFVIMAINRLLDDYQPNGD